MNAMTTLKAIVARGPQQAAQPADAPVLNIAVTPAKERGRYWGVACAHATTAQEANRHLDDAFRGVTVPLSGRDVFMFGDGAMTARDPLRGQALVYFGDATKRDVDLLRSRATNAFLPRKRTELRQLIEGLNDHEILRCPTYEQWRAAATEHARGDVREWLVERWFMGQRAPEAVERKAYALMEQENALRARLK